SREHRFIGLFCKWVRAPFNNKDLTSQNHKISKSSSLQTSDEVYFWYSTSMPNDCGDGFVLNAESLTLNCVGRGSAWLGFPPATGARWPGALCAAAPAFDDIRP